MTAGYRVRIDAWIPFLPNDLEDDGRSAIRVLNSARMHDDKTIGAAFRSLHDLSVSHKFISRTQPKPGPTPAVEMPPEPAVPEQKTEIARHGALVSRTQIEELKP